jgi:alkylation response protein AidB-like acyl-CoA dehydrogenase
MDFALGDDVETLRAELRSFLDEHVTDDLEAELYRTGGSYDEAFTVAMRDRGLLTAGWPEEWGGARHDPVELGVIRDELQRADAPIYATGTTHLVAKALLRVGTEEQRRDILPQAVRGEVIIVLGFSEPEAGSDVANAQTRAVRDGDVWVINGSKMFTTNAHIADYVFLLTRTNPDVPKHRGLTTFLVPMHQPGVEVQAVYTVSGERTNITYYNDVRVDDRWRIGEVDGGWHVMVTALQEEHSAGFGARIHRLLEEAEAWSRRATGDDGRARIEDPDVREALARCATQAEVARLLQLRSAWMAKKGDVPVAEGPMAKLFSSEALERSAQDLCDVVGPDALRSYLEPSAPQRGRIEHALRFSLGTTIYGGTSEIQRNLIARFRCGLPRAGT